MTPSIRTIAIVLMVCAAITVVPAQLAGTSLTADRSSNIGLATDSTSAYLAIDSQNDIGQLKGNDGAVQIATLTNTLGESTDVEVRVENIPGASNSILDADPDGVTVADGDSISAEVACAESTDFGTKDVVFGAYANGSTTTVTNATFTVTIEGKCSSGTIQSTESGLAGVSASNLTDGDASQDQTFEFQVTEDMASGESVTMTLKKVTGGNRIDYSGASFTADPAGSVSGQKSGSDYVITYTANTKLVAGDTVQITASGVDASGSQAGDKAPYDVIFERSGYSVTESTTFDVN